MTNELKCCPFCDAPPIAGSDYHYHPANDCILSGFEIPDADVDKWNLRQFGALPTNFQPDRQTSHSY